jgi:hypothetical protein
MKAALTVLFVVILALIASYLLGWSSYETQIEELRVCFPEQVA